MKNSIEANFASGSKYSFFNRSVLDKTINILRSGEYYVSRPTKNLLKTHHYGMCRGIYHSKHDRTFAALGNAIFEITTSLDIKNLGTVEYTYPFFSFAENAKYLMITTGKKLYSVDLISELVTLKEVNIAAQLPISITCINNIFVIADGSKNIFYYSVFDDKGITWKEIVFLSFPAPLTAVASSGNRLYVFSKSGMEIWSGVYNSTTDVPFVRQNSASLALGCLSSGSMVERTDGIFFLGHMEGEPPKAFSIRNEKITNYDLYSFESKAINKLPSDYINYFYGNWFSFYHNDYYTLTFGNTIANIPSIAIDIANGSIVELQNCYEREDLIGYARFKGGYLAGSFTQENLYYIAAENTLADNYFCRIFPEIVSLDSVRFIDAEFALTTGGSILTYDILPAEKVKPITFNLMFSTDGGVTWTNERPEQLTADEFHNFNQLLNFRIYETLFNGSFAVKLDFYTDQPFIIKGGRFSVEVFEAS